MQDRKPTRKASRGRHSSNKRTFGDGMGHMSNKEWSDAWKREVDPFVVPCATSFLIGGIIMAALLSL